MIGLWIAFQFFNGWGAAMLSEETVGGVAYGAHIGGFAAGVILAFILRSAIREAPGEQSRRAGRGGRPIWRGR
jgi:membrane associated rhomboid family serine protease